MRKSSLVASLQEANPQMTLKHMAPLKSLRLCPNHSGEILSFVIKVAALETVRRLSKARCPILWRFVEAFQVLGYPPLKWLQRWGPLRLIIRGTQDALLSIHPYNSTVWTGNWSKLCPACKIIKPLRSEHCSTCKHFVDQFDQHCPWISNYIGKGCGWDHLSNYLLEGGFSISPQNILEHLLLS